IVTAAAATTMVVSGYPSPTQAGVTHNFVVTVRDAFGNTATGYTGSVVFASSDGQAVLPPSYTFTSGDAGSHTFAATFKSVGTQSLTATDSTNSLTGTQSGILVNPGVAVAFVVAGYPSPTNAGDAHNFTVTAKDAFGNTATGYTGTVTFSSSDTQAALPPNYNFTPGDAGAHV